MFRRYRRLRKCICVFVPTYLSDNLSTRIHVYMLKCNTCMFVQVSQYVCIYVYTHTYKFTQLFVFTYQLRVGASILSPSFCARVRAWVCGVWGIRLLTEPLDSTSGAMQRVQNPSGSQAQVAQVGASDNTFL